MKKFFYAIMAAVLPVMALSLASCNDDDNLPDVNISLSVDNASIVDGTIYVVQGDTLNVTAVNVNNNQAGKGAAITNVKYFIDGFYFGDSFFSPFPAYNITSAETPVGNYQLGITCTVLAVDKSIATGYLSYPIKVVSSQAEIPSTVARSSMQSQMSLSK